MKNENNYFEVIPKVVRANSTTVIKIKPLYAHCEFKQNAEYEVNYYPLERFSQIGEYNYQDKKLIKPLYNCLYIEQYFKDEQEHIIEINELIDGNIQKSMKFHVYSLKEDLFERRPYKGDMHLHTFYSDGVESPDYVTACCRKIGLDFMGITDHRKYYPSIEAQERFKDVDTDLLICRGEEVHPPQNPVHMINFGGSFSVNEIFRNEEKKYYKEVKHIEEGLCEIADSEARYQCASSIWCFDKIREGGGLGIFCHPYWLWQNQYYISDTVISYMLEHQPYDANELISGYALNEIDSNKLQVARYYEERAKGRNIPIVGVSDAHGCEGYGLFGWYYTIVFASCNNQENIFGSIRKLYSVAVEAMPNDTIRVYGPFRMVKYALFLVNEIFPQHDEMCFEEGQLMLRHISGDKKAGEILSILKGQTKELYEELWAK